MLKFELNLPILGETISCTKYAGHEDEPPVLYFFHGAGAATKDRIAYLAEPLQDDYGIASMSFNFSGHGDSTGSIGNSSLSKKIAEANAVIEYTNQGGPISVFASSMGAHIALSLLNNFKIDTLVLFCPGIYSNEALDRKFGPSFTEAITKPFGWRNSNCFTNLESFEGNLLVVVGDKDDVLPWKDEINRESLIDVIMYSAKKTKRKELVIVNEAPHLLHGWFQKNPDKLKDIFDTVVSFLQ